MKIKFRAKTLGGQWVYGNVSILTQKVHHVDAGTYISNSVGVPFAYAVRPETLGQYVGLTDKNGNEIYFGQKVKITIGDPFVNQCICRVVENMGAFGVIPIEGEIDVFGNVYTGKMLPFFPDFKPSFVEILEE
jgi:hypothetical protein